jgi:hypothetical protein
LPPPDLTEEVFDEVEDADEQQFGTISMPMGHTAAGSAVVEEATPSDDRLETLITIVSDLVLRVDSTQRQLDNLQSQPPRSIPPASCGSVAVPQPSSGAIPKKRSSQVPANSEMLPKPVSSSCDFPALADLRADPDLSLKAAQMVDNLEAPLPGNRTLRRGWARPGGDNAPRVTIPWPQDYVLGNGKQKHLCYLDLNIYGEKGDHGNMCVNAAGIQHILRGTALWASVVPTSSGLSYS